MNDVQYGKPASSVYDLLLSDPIPADATVDRLRERVAGQMVLELGVGTGRIAAPLAAHAARIVGIDNSAPMLEVFREKGVPANVELVQADFRNPLPVPDGFDLAYSTLGSLACCRSVDELATALGHVADRLRPDGTLCLEYYSADTYSVLLPASPFAAQTPQGHPFEIALDLDPATRVLTSRTSVRPDDELGSFTEDVLLLDGTEVEHVLTAAGFTVTDVHREPGAAFDWYDARRSTAKGDRR